MNADENLSFVSQSPKGRTKMEIRPAAILIQLSIVSTMENVRPGSRGDAKPGARKRSLSNAEAHTHLRLSKALAHIKPPQLSDHTLYLSMTIVVLLCITWYPNKVCPKNVVASSHTQNVAFGFWHFPPIFDLLKLTCLVTLFEPSLKLASLVIKRFNLSNVQFLVIFWLQNEKFPSKIISHSFASLTIEQITIVGWWKP